MARSFAHPKARQPVGSLRRLRDLIVIGGLLLLTAACGSGGAAVGPSTAPVGSPDIEVLEVSPGPSASIDPAGLCQRIDELELSSARLRAIDLKETNRVPLDIALGELMLAFDELARAELGEFEEQLANPLQRLDYRLTEVELAVEDFRTNPRIRRAARHVEGDTRTFAGEVAAFRVLARC